MTCQDSICYYCAVCSCLMSFYVRGTGKEPKFPTCWIIKIILNLILNMSGFLCFMSWILCRVLVVAQIFRVLSLIVLLPENLYTKRASVTEFCSICRKCETVGHQDSSERESSFHSSCRFDAISFRPFIGSSRSEMTANWLGLPPPRAVSVSLSAHYNLIGCR